MQMVEDREQGKCYLLPAPLMTIHLWVVDKIHADHVVVVCDDGRAASVAPDRLPDGIRERDVLRAASDEKGTPDWTSATLDRDETERRRQQSAEWVKTLRKTDEHGFLESP